MKRREWRELRSLFGQEAVDAAIANQEHYQQWALHHPNEFSKAARLLSELKNDDKAAMLFIEQLDPSLKRALIVALLKYYTS